MLIPSLRCCYPMTIRPRRIVPNMLLMSTLKISNPVEALIQMIIHDPARCSCWCLRIHIWPASILRSLPSQVWNPLGQPPIPARGQPGFLGGVGTKGGELKFILERKRGDNGRLRRKWALSCPNRCPPCGERPLRSRRLPSMDLSRPRGFR
jgi:hypothetical protein